MTIAAGHPAHAALADFYARAAVRARLAEFLRGSGTAAAYGGARWLHGAEDAPVVQAMDRVPSILDEGADLFRGAADDGGTLLLLDVDFVHPADPGEASRDPGRCFRRLEAAHRAARGVFADHGIVPLVVMTATGYRYVARAAVGGRLHEGMAALGASDHWTPPANGSAEARRAEEAHRGAGRLVEFLAHRVVHEARVTSELPVALADVPPAGADPFVRVDPSAYADRAADLLLRSAFSSDQTALVTRPGSTTPFVVVLPCGDAGLDDLLALRTDLEAAASYAARVSVAIPDVPEACTILRDHDHSGLAAFQAELDHSPVAADWVPAAPGIFDPESAAPCSNAVLRYPSPRLLQPRHLRTIALTLWSTGWHPRSIAALVAARYREPHDWGTHWLRHDPDRAASFFVRLFCAAAADGLDDGLFTCETESRHASCPAGGCGYDLGVLFRRLRTLRARNEAHA
jgi:hypothetical protein